MKILSWDVGIYNLSYCILEKNDDSNIKIIDWNIVNLIDNDSMKKNTTLIFENIPRKLQEIPQLLDVDIVVIENQPSLKNPKMKSIQMILYSYFLILGKVIGNGDKCNGYIDKIDFCSASNKLKVYDGPEIILDVKKPRKKKINNDVSQQETIHEEITQEEETLKETVKPIQDPSEEGNEKNEKKTKKKTTIKYADKKKIAILHTQYYLEKKNADYLDFFNKHKKKDDLADSYLQGLYWYKQLK